MPVYLGQMHVPSLVCLLAVCLHLATRDPRSKNNIAVFFIIHHDVFCLDISMMMGYKLQTHINVSVVKFYTILPMTRPHQSLRIRRISLRGVNCAN